ncbi:MAG: hypothetical protein IIX90_02155, partial [Clostridia bacterium]|nr:hypothetical protein [Clostridia bacterium]
IIHSIITQIGRENNISAEICLAAGAHLQANAPPPYVMKLNSPLRMQREGEALLGLLKYLKKH